MNYIECIISFIIAKYTIYIPVNNLDSLQVFFYLIYPALNNSIGHLICYLPTEDSVYFFTLQPPLPLSFQSFQSFSQFSPSITLNTHHAGNIHNPLLRHSIPIHLQKHRITPRAAETIRSVWRTRAAIPWHCSKSPVYLWC